MKFIMSCHLRSVRLLRVKENVLGNSWKAGGGRGGGFRLSGKQLSEMRIWDEGFLLFIEGENVTTCPFSAPTGRFSSRPSPLPILGPSRNALGV